MNKKKITGRHKKIAGNSLKIAPAKSVHRTSGVGLRASGNASGKRGAPVATSATTEATGVIANQETHIASLEKQIAALEEKIAMLQGETSDSGLQVSGGSLNTNPEVRSQKSEVRPKVGPPLGTPVIDNIMAIGAHSMRVSWSPVTNAGGYAIRYSTDETFATDVNEVSVDDATTAVTLNGLSANTTYYLSVKTLGNGTSIDSPFSAAQSAMTATGDSITGDLQHWLDELETLFQNVATLVPQLETTDLNTTDRRRLNGSGVRRYGFIEKVYEVSGEYPQFWPPFGEGREELAEYVKEIDVLRNLLIWFRYASRVVQDLLLIAGDEAFRVAGAYYTFARAGARRKNPEAVAVSEMLRLFWRRRRRITDEPTEMEALRDAKALLRGSKDGTITVSNESDSVIKGEKVIIDNTMPKPRGGVKVIESAQSAE